MSETKWNKTKAIRLVEHITSKMPEGKQRTSWYVALGTALAMHEEARLYDIAVAKAIDNYIDRHGNVLPHYVLDDATSLRDYIRQEVRRGTSTS